MEGRSQRAQLLGSLLAAAAIALIVVIAVTARLGPTSVAEEEARIEQQEQRLEAQEQRLEGREEAREEARD